MRRLFILAMFSFLLAMPSSGLDTEVVVAADDCLPFDSKCLEEQAACDYWDPLCKDDLERCQYGDLSCSNKNNSSGPTTQRSNADVEYTEEVSCSLVLKELFGGVSGYCDVTLGAILNHCIVNQVSRSDKYSVDFLCSDSAPGLMEKSSNDEIRLTNLGSTFMTGEPFWIICDEGMRASATNKRCYDSEFSDSDDWEIGCSPDNRIDKVYDYPDTFVWYVCD